MRWWIVLAIVGGVAAAAEPALEHPLIRPWGGVVPQPRAAEQPRAAARIVFDITSDVKPDELNKGLESVARYLNLHALAGHAAADLRLALVLHGPATRAALADAPYAARTGAGSNPNLALVRALKQQGVEVFVCGQALARQKFAVDEVAPEFTVAVSAMTVNVNKQQDGYAYIALH